MKKIVFALASIIYISLTSCESDDKNIFLELERSHTVAMKINNENISLSGSSFTADVDAYKVASHSLRVFQQSVNDTVNFATYTDFPFTLTITKEDIAGALSMDVNSIELNDNFIFLGTSTSEDGTVYTISDFTAVGGALINNPNMNFSSKAYRFNIEIVE